MFILITSNCQTQNLRILLNSLEIQGLFTMARSVRLKDRGQHEAIQDLLLLLQHLKITAVICRSGSVWLYYWCSHSKSHPLGAGTETELGKKIVCLFSTYLCQQLGWLGVHIYLSSQDGQEYITMSEARMSRSTYLCQQLGWLGVHTYVSS